MLYMFPKHEETIPTYLAGSCFVPMGPFLGHTAIYVASNFLVMILCMISAIVIRRSILKKTRTEQGAAVDAGGSPQRK